MNTVLSRCLAAGLALAVVACGSSRAPEAPSTSKPASDAVPDAPKAATARSGALTAAQYHRDFAEHLTRQNQEHVYDGAPPNPLYAVVVMEVELSRDGKVLGVKPLRVPSHGQAQYRAARESVMRGQPYPKPAVTVAMGKPRVAFTETWLFDNRGRFQLRSLALPQQGE
jgi:protein TonB